jgi:hypothetical protein
MGAARSLLRQTSPFEHMLKEEPVRYKHLEELLSKPYYDAADVRMSVCIIYVCFRAHVEGGARLRQVLETAAVQAAL